MEVVSVDNIKGKFVFERMGEEACLLEVEVEGEEGFFRKYFKLGENVCV